MFPTDPSTFINSNSAITILPGTGMAANTMASTLGIPVHEAHSLADDEQLAYEVGKATRVVKMARYWQDELFCDRFDPLPRFRKREVNSSASLVS